MKFYNLAKEFLINRLGDQQIAIRRRLRRKLRRIRNLDDSAKILRHMHRIIAQRPVQIATETYSLCNSQVSRQLMSLELFEKICSEYAELGGGFLGFSPLLAEPLLDPLLLERIRMIRKHFPNIYPHMFTNGIALTEFSGDELIEMLTTLKIINVSIGGLNRVDYRIMFGVDRFNKVSESLNRLSKINQELESRCKLGLHIRTHRREAVINSPELGKFEKLGYKCYIAAGFSDWGGLVTEKDLPEGAKLIRKDNSKCITPCLIPMTNMMFMPDGRVLGCGCMDGKEETYVGHLGESSLQDIWKGNAYNNLRSSFRKGKLYPLCKTCSYYNNYEEVLSRPGLKNFEPSQCFYECI
jgi:radical SAM protein with 4Fe4S-binding SPASM domain